MFPISSKSPANHRGLVICVLMSSAPPDNSHSAAMSRSPNTSASDDFEDFATLNIELANIATGRTRERSIFPARQASVQPIDMPRPRPLTEDPSPLAKAMESTLHVVYFYFILATSITLAFIDVIAFPGGVFKHVLKSYQYYELVVLVLGCVILVWLIASAARSRHEAQADKERSQSPDDVSQGLNFLLRFGLAFFCMGTLILQLLRAISPLEGKACLAYTEPLRLVRLSSCILYTILQSYFIFKYHRRKFTKHARLVRLALLHMVAVNLGLWFRSVVLEGKEMCESWALPIHNGSSPENATACATTPVALPGSEYASCDVQNLASKSAQPYLFPCTVQYALISAGAFANMYLRVEDAEEGEDDSMMSSASSTTVQEISTNRHAEVVVRTSKVRAYSVQHLVVPQTHLCAKSHTGFFCSILFTVLYILFDVTQLLYHAHNGDMSPEVFKIVYTVTDGVFHGCALLVVVALFFRMIRQLNYHRERRSFIDRSLMLIAFFAQVLFSFFLLHANVRQVKRGELMDIYSILRHGLHLLLFSCQTVFILTGVNMRAMNEYQVRHKPGKNLLTILITANLMFWFEESLLLSNHVNSEKYQNYYGYLTWCLLLSACKPLVVFYKFHSASMLAEMWVNAYNFCLLDLRQVPKDGREEEEEQKSE